MEGFNAYLKLMHDTYKRQGYHFVGVQAVVKPCHWTKKSLISGGREFCYKQKFYGIPSHRCLQMSPIIQCSQRCLYCWRAQPSDLKISFDELKVKVYDDPYSIVENSVSEWQKILSGYYGNHKIDPVMLQEAMRPIHAAISLVGEPTMYPRISELIEAFFEYGFKTTFIVTNGNFPEVISSLEREPSQLYLSLSAPDEETYRKVCRPLLKDGWRRVLESLELLKSLSCPTVVRITLVKGLNTSNIEKYAKLLADAEPTYIEPKAAMSLGYFRHRLDVNSMPRHQEVREFAEKLAEYSGYNIIDESLSSRIVLLSKLRKPIKLI
ncbi:MAG: 4-demethylwyosine synthase TYW1 [Thermoprotei archaeon]|nr:MAG: 4-demethylwyosine synthase TYW1 [Thermoprotei archaeon]